MYGLLEGPYIGGNNTLSKEEQVQLLRDSLTEIKNQSKSIVNENKELVDELLKKKNERLVFQNYVFEINNEFHQLESASKKQEFMKMLHLQNKPKNKDNNDKSDCTQS